MDLLSKLMPLKARHEELSALMSQGGLGGDAFVKLSREYAELEPIVTAVNGYEKALKDFEDVQTMLKYGINNMGLLFENDLRFLKQFQE